MNTIKEISINKSIINQGFFYGSIVLIICFILLFITGKLIIAPFILTLLFLSVTILRTRHRLIKVFENHIELRNNFLGPLILIRNKDFVDYVIKGNKLLIHYRDYDGTIATYVILEKKMKKDDFDDFIMILLAIKENNHV